MLTGHDHIRRRRKRRRRRETDRQTDRQTDRDRQSFEILFEETAVSNLFV